MTDATSYRYAKAEVRRVKAQLNIRQDLRFARALNAYYGGELSDIVRESGVPRALSNTVAQYLKGMVDHVGAYRTQNTPADPWSMLDRDKRAVRVAASKALNEIQQKNSTAYEMQCNGKPASVEKIGGYRHAKVIITVGVGWLMRVKGAGIAIAETSSKPVFVVSATPKSSAFLAEEGVTAFEVLAYEAATSSAKEGYVLVSRGPTDGQNFVVFHEDFMKGVALIRRRISKKVLATLLGEG